MVNIKLIINSNFPSNQKIVIVSHSKDEAITRFLINNKQVFEENIAVLTLQDLIFGCDIFDEVSDVETRIHWRTAGGVCISNKDYFLLNRVLYVPDSLFNDFIEEDRSYAKREIEAYIGFSFNAFEGVGNKSSTGVCVNSRSLPQQWSRIKKNFNVKVPRYYWGPMQGISLPEKGNLIYSKIYNYLHWAANQKPIDQQHVFCFEKPQGSPVFILSIGSKQLLTSDDVISKDQENILKKLAENINKHFDHFISEILFFVSGSDLVFGCINPEVIKSNKNIDDFIYMNLMNEFFKWIN